MSFGGDLLSVDTIDEQVNRKLQGLNVDYGLATRCINDAEKWCEKGEKSSAWLDQVKRVLG